VQTQTKKPIKRSDVVTFGGTLSGGFGTLPAAMYRANLTRVEHVNHSDMGRDVRDWFAENIRKSIAEPEASLGIGYLVGQRSTLPETLDDQLRLLGLTHVVVASGYNLTILIRFTRRLFARVSKYAAFTTAIMMVAGFVLMTGFSPSMSRAALVTGLSLVAWYFGRSIQPLVLLALVAAITGYLNPFFVWGDIGWYLSMLSFAGIMILAPLIRHYFFGAEAQLGIVTSIAIETMSAQIVTLPLILYIFGQYSPFALFANALILPFIPFAMLAVFITGLTVIFIPLLSGVIHWPATIILRYMTKTVDIIAAMPGALGELSFSKGALVLSYFILILVCVVLRKKTHHNFGQDNIVI
jgi:competence protein ComEC